MPGCKDTPDKYRIVVSDTQAYKQFGNSVVVPLIAQVAKLVKEKFEELDSRQPELNDEKKLLLAGGAR